ncbi:hypothetical protein QL285_015192 [Trifolium repens]|nr:hypothetical protein QL285_015192 [Trifolium repens]
MGDEQRVTMGDYCKRTNTDQISLGFQPANPANFDIKGNVLTGPAKDWLQWLPRGTIATWKELEDKFLERFFTQTLFQKRKFEILSFK